MGWPVNPRQLHWMCHISLWCSQVSRAALGVGGGILWAWAGQPMGWPVNPRQLHWMCHISLWCSQVSRTALGVCVGGGHSVSLGWAAHGLACQPTTASEFVQQMAHEWCFMLFRNILHFILKMVILLSGAELRVLGHQVGVQVTGDDTMFVQLPRNYKLPKVDAFNVQLQFAMRMMPCTYVIHSLE